MFDVVFDPYNYPFWILIFITLAGIIAVIFRPFSTYIKFVYPNAKFEAIGNPFITEKELSRIIDSKDLIDFKDSLNTLKDYNVSGDDTYDIQQSLDTHFIDTIRIMRKDSNKKMYKFFDTYFEKLDSYLIKNALKNKFEDKEIDAKLIDEAILQNTKTLLRKIMDSEKENILNILKSIGFEEELINIFSDEKVDFFKIDSMVDKHIFNKFKQIKIPYKCDKAKQKFVNTIIDINNVKNLLRAKQLGYDEATIKKIFIGPGYEIASWKFKEMAELESISQVISSLEGTSYYDPLRDAIEDYDKDRSVQILENTIDSLFLKLVRDISTQYYVTIGPTLRFLVSKEYEIKNLKIIAKGIGEKLSLDIIKKFIIKEASM